MIKLTQQTAPHRIPLLLCETHVSTYVKGHKQFIEKSCELSSWQPGAIKNKREGRLVGSET